MEQLLFFPAGPGFNSNPEHQLLAEKYAAAGILLKGWHEPSRLRPHGYAYHKTATYRHYLHSAEQFLLEHYNGAPLAISGCCFGSHPLRYLLAAHPDKISRAVVITPNFCPGKTDYRMLLAVRDDYRALQDERAAQVQQVIDRYSGRFDDNTEAGFLLAVQDPHLFSNYWYNKQQMLPYLQHYSGPAYGIDMEGLCDTRKSMFETSLEPCPVPVLVIYGRHEKIVSLEDELKGLPRYFDRLQVAEMEHSAHYPHIEEPDAVLEVIKAFMSDGVAAASSNARLLHHIKP